MLSTSKPSELASRHDRGLLVHFAIYMNIVGEAQCVMHQR